MSRNNTYIFSSLPSTAAKYWARFFTVLFEVHWKIKIVLIFFFHYDEGRHKEKKNAEDNFLLFLGKATESKVITS